jgi:hypothetical protein
VQAAGRGVTRGTIPVGSPSPDGAVTMDDLDREPRGLCTRLAALSSRARALTLMSSSHVHVTAGVLLEVEDESVVCHGNSREAVRAPGGAARTIAPRAGLSIHDRSGAEAIGVT